MRVLPFFCVKEMNVKVSIVIPHYGDGQILHRCLQSLAGTAFRGFEVVVVDNGSNCGEAEFHAYPFPIVYHRSPENLGFAGGCNLGVRMARGELVVLLNNDTEVEPGWLEPLVELMDSDPRIAACQPRLLSMRRRGYLDYAGAMGGLMDLFGYTFAIGRVFDVTEPDEGQYSGRYRIFWASGTASVWRRRLFLEAGGLDEDFFAHMEEVDLNWRLQLLGYRICSTASSRVHHFSGYTLGPETLRKMYLNHRNNLAMMLKNSSGAALLWQFPAREALELVTALQALLTLNWKRFLAVLWAQVYLLLHAGAIWRKHLAVQKLRQLGDSKVFQNLYRGSVVWQYYVRRRKRVSEFLQLERCNESS